MARPGSAPRAWIAALCVVVAGCATQRLGPAPTPCTIGQATLVAADHRSLPGWSSAVHIAPLVAFRQSCSRFADAPDGQATPAFLGAGEAWRAACEEAWDVPWFHAAAARAFFETRFNAYRLILDGEEEGRLTAYFEPEVEARRERTPPFVEPILAPPADLVTERTIGPDGAVISDSIQILPDGSRRPYPPREDVYAAAHDAMAWGRVSDVTFLQIQGSGRLRFPDGEVVRAAFAAHNGRPYRSILRILIDEGEIAEEGADNDAVRAWLDQVPLDEARAALNQNARYVFFSQEPVDQALIGPVGAAGEPLTPGASIAVDPRRHGYGGLYWVASAEPGAPAPRLTVAQDTGGAITGPLRADLFLGSGARAGQQADRVNHMIQWWTLLPQNAATACEEGEPDGQAPAQR